jgi:integrase
MGSGGAPVRSTKERSRLAAAEVAEEIVSDLKEGKRLDRVSRDRAFEFYAEKMLENDERASGQSLHRLTALNERSLLYRQPDGVLTYLGRMDVGSVRTPNIRNYLNWVDDQREQPLAASTKSKHVNVIRKVLKTAYEAKAIDSIPPLPKVPRRDNPRNWFDEEEYERLLATARESAKEGIKVRGVPITMELYYFIVFLVHSFLRPTESEVFALKHRAPERRPEITPTPRRENQNKECDSMVRYNRVRARFLRPPEGALPQSQSNRLRLPARVSEPHHREASV